MTEKHHTDPGEQKEIQSFHLDSSRSLHKILYKGVLRGPPSFFTASSTFAAFKPQYKRRATVTSAFTNDVRMNCLIIVLVKRSI